jgi:exosome complex RNA-binding protein Rrp42 (RNase PH superfamily)
MLSCISATERAYIETGVEKGVRVDGRAPHELRRLHVFSGDLPHASGAARAVVGSTDVLAVVKAELVPCSGAEAVSGSAAAAAAAVGARSAVDVTALVHTGATGGRRGADDGAELAATLQRFLNAPGIIDLAALVALAGAWEWRLTVDVVVSSSDGGVLDVAAAAAVAALRTTRLPKLRAVKTEGGSELKLDDNPAAFDELPFANALPVLVTIQHVRGLKLVDTTALEETCSTGAVSVGVGPTNRICFMSAHGSGLTPHVLHEALLAAVQLAPRTRAAIATFEAAIR